MNETVDFKIWLTTEHLPCSATQDSIPTGQRGLCGLKLPLERSMGTELLFS
jgi:hypothetical protein